MVPHWSKSFCHWTPKLIPLPTWRALKRVTLFFWVPSKIVIIIVLCAVKIKLKTLEFQGLAHHKHSIGGHYNNNFNYYMLHQYCIIYTQPWTYRCTELELLPASAEPHTCGHSSPCLPFISLPLQQNLQWIRIQSSHLTQMIHLSFQMQHLFLQGTHLWVAKFVEVIWVGSLSTIYESVLADVVALGLPACDLQLEKAGTMAPNSNSLYRED